MSVPTQKARVSAKDKLVSELQRLFAATGDKRFAAAAEAACEHPSAFPLPGRKPRSPERLGELNSMAERVYALAVGGASLPAACRQAVHERHGSTLRKAERDREAEAVYRHYQMEWRLARGIAAGELDDLRELLS